MKAYIKKITYYLPKKIEYNPDNKLTQKLGVLKRHICPKDETAADLAYSAACKLFREGIEKEKVQFLILCSQSPDYFLPTTSCILQDKLGLKETCGAYDFNLGCSGYIYGLSMAKALIESGIVENVLLLTSDTYSKYINEKDSSLKYMFGDGASATYIEAVDTDVPGLDGFVFGTDGSRYKDLIVEVGGLRNPYTTTTLQEITDEFGNYRTNRDMSMNGVAITEFILDTIPKLIDDVLKKTKLAKDEIDYFVMHQANEFMLKWLQKKSGLLGYPYWNNVKEYGNTVSSTIPIALADMMDNNKNANTILGAGFGVGLSWAGCIIRLDMCGKDRLL